MISKNRLWEIQRSISQRGRVVLTGFQSGRLSMVEQLIEECSEDWIPIEEFMSNPIEGPYHVANDKEICIAWYCFGKFYADDDGEYGTISGITRVSPIKSPK